MKEYTEVKDRRIDNMKYMFRGAMQALMYCAAMATFMFSSSETLVVSGMIWLLTIYVLLTSK
jgi:hypothetical protein